jgi:F0F1-type ATP synthase assembly protein I
MSEPSEPKDNKDQNRKQIYAEIGPFLGLGVQLAVTVVIMALIGNWLDEKFHKAPLFLIIGAFFGAFAGMYNFIKAALDIEKKSKK